jgi:hypothetical protein
VRAPVYGPLVWCQFSVTWFKNSFRFHGAQAPEAVC